MKYRGARTDRCEVKETPFLGIRELLKVRYLMVRTGDGKYGFSFFSSDFLNVCFRIRVLGMLIDIRSPPSHSWSGYLQRDLSCDGYNIDHIECCSLLYLRIFFVFNIRNTNFEDFLVLSQEVKLMGVSQ